MKSGKMIRAVLAGAAAVALWSGAALADEGMWTLDNPPTAQIEKAYGVKVTQAWLDKVRLGSVRLAGGCSGSFISPQGLVMTNHHCIRSCVQQLSTPENDLMANGFMAASTADERKCAGIEINQLVEIRDVTAEVQQAVAGKTGAAFNDARRAKLSELEKACTGTEAGTRCDAVTLYQGGRYSIYKYKRFQDVRLAFVPEWDIGAFGGDPDNFNFPRYTLDMGLLRVYGADGKPLSTPEHFAWSKAGAKDGEPVFVTGHPGGTSRLRTTAELVYFRDFFAPTYLQWAQEKRGRLIEFSRRGKEEERQALEELNSLENGIKVWRGRQQALSDREFFGKKVAEEQALRQAIAAKPELQQSVGDAYAEIDRAVELNKALLLRQFLLESGRGFDSTLARHARRLVRAADEQAKPNAERLREYSEARIPVLKQQLSNPAPVETLLEVATLSFSLEKVRAELGMDDALVKQIFGKKSPLQLAQELVSGTKLGDPAERMRLFEGGKAAVDASTDPMIKLMKLVDAEARAVRKRVEEQVDAPIEAAQARLAQARFQVYGDKVYPDATFSLRLSYGAIKGWTEADGREVKPFTNYAGLYERATGEDPFTLPPSWIKAQGKVKMDTPFNGVSTNDIIGGNSGSPLLNKDAQIVGLVFDGNIHSLAGEYGYDGARNRTVFVDSRGMAEAMRSVYGADALLKEMGIR
ncbi:MAG TPA: S46 family peptidase [Azospirillaceae bacterium]|nr:S46 family peptidase [Azospirillaceae bacterium]